MPVTILRIPMAVALSVQSPMAWSTADVIGTAGDYSRSSSQGALANRKMADQMYKQALADHDRAWSSFPPNVSLLSKALTLSKEAKMADDQAKEFARAAMHGVHTGGNSGDFKLKEYGVASEKELNNLANSSSPYMGQVEKTLGGYGMKLSADKMSLKTPFGTLPVDMSLSALEKGVRTIAASLGYSADDVSKGIQEAVNARNAIAAAAQAELQKQAGAGAGATAGAAVPGAGPEGSAAIDEGARPAAAAAVSAADSSFSDADPAAAGITVTAIDKRQEELQRNRALFLQKMGVGSSDPIGKSHQDIFKMVHLRYQSIRAQGEFIEREIPIELAANLPKRAPAAVLPRGPKPPPRK